MIRCKPTGSDDTVDMGMMLQSLVPGVEHAEEADLGSKVSRIASDFEQRCGAGAEQQAIDQPLVLERERSQFTRQREHGMDVTRGQQLPLALLEPADAGAALASWAVPVTARVVGDSGLSAVGAPIAMAAESGSAATRDRSQHLLMLAVDPLVTALDEAVAGVANDLGHLHRGAAQTLRSASPGVPSRSMSSGLAVALRCFRDKWR